MKRKYKYEKTDKRGIMMMFSKFSDKSIAIDHGDYVVFYNLCYSCESFKVNDKNNLLKLLNGNGFIIKKINNKWYNMNSCSYCENNSKNKKVNLDVVINILKTTLNVINVVRKTINN